MKVEPYTPRSARTKALWDRIGTELGVHPVIARDAYWDYWPSGISPDRMVKMIEERPELREGFKKFTPEELEAKQKRLDEAASESDFSDLLNHRLKALIQVGDEVVSNETKTYTFHPEIEHITRGKRYPIIELREDREDGPCGFTAITLTNQRNKNREYWSVHGVRSLWREGVEIWNWELEFFKLWLEQNPGHKDEQLMRESCELHASYTSRGERPPRQVRSNTQETSGSQK